MAFFSATTTRVAFGLAGCAIALAIVGGCARDREAESPSDATTATATAPPPAPTPTLQAPRPRPSPTLFAPHPTPTSPPQPTAALSPSEAAELYHAQDACLSNCDQFACMRIAGLYREGTSVPRDPLAGRRYAIHACLECGSPGAGIEEQCPSYGIAPPKKK